MEAREYWHGVSGSATFTHPLPEPWLDGLPLGARILDFGCGYGRILARLAELGFVNTVGVDFAPGMIERGRGDFPELDLKLVDGLPLAEPTASFDAILLFAVLTTIPDDATQAALVRELHRLLRPGGRLLLSDMPMQTDAHYLARYRAGAAEFGRYGLFRSGAVMRHHEEAYLDALFVGFDCLESRTIPVLSLNGNPAVALQRLWRRTDRPG